MKEPRETDIPQPEHRDAMRALKDLGQLEKKLGELCAVNSESLDPLLHEMEQSLAAVETLRKSSEHYEDPHPVPRTRHGSEVS